jgi:hypothetical protein
MNLCYFKENEANLRIHMKIYCILFVFLLLQCLGGQTQQRATSLPEKAKGKSQAVGFGVYLPVGIFSESHIAGAGFDYTRSRHWFGKGISPAKPIGFILHGGVSYFLGKKTTTLGYDFRYGGYLNLYAMPGIIYNPVKNGNIALTAGPALNLYKGSVNAEIGINFSTNYFISENIAVGPGVVYKKHTNTDALWAVAIRASYIF